MGVFIPLDLCTNTSSLPDGKALLEDSFIKTQDLVKQDCEEDLQVGHREVLDQY